MKKLMHKKLVLIFSLLFLFSISFIVFLTPLQDPLKIFLDSKLQPPSLAHLFGTDELGRDLLSRVVYGFCSTLLVSILALITSIIIGIIVGLVAGHYYGTLIDACVNWLSSLIFSLPFLLIMSSILFLIGPNIFNAYLALALIMWVSPGRIVRAEVIKLEQRQPIKTLRAYGMRETQIFFVFIMPEAIKSAVIFSFSYLPEIIGLEVGLSFLGLGVQPPKPGLGKMIFDGLSYIYSAPWIALFPALLLFMVTCTFNMIVKRHSNYSYEVER